MTTKTFQLFFFTLILLSIAVKCQDQHEEEGHVEGDEDQASSVTLNESERWGFGFLAGFGISAIGFLTALVLVSCKKLASDNCFEMSIKFFFSLAFGALLGDAMIHILPEAYKAEGSDSRIVAGIFIGSIMFFLLLERSFAACGISHQHWHSNQCHDDHQGAIQRHNHPNKIKNQDQGQQNNMTKVVPIDSNTMIIEEVSSNSNNCKKDHKHGKKQSHGGLNQIVQSNSHEHSKQCEQQKSCLQNLKGKGTAGYMNLLGSFIHNFMDGLALGVSFATGSPKVFVPILVAIIAHQIPREMGDVAILMTSKFSSTQTILCNGFVNLVSLLGVVIGLAITNLQQTVQMYILVFVAGNFIFIAADIWKNLFKNKTFSKNLIQFFGFGIGITSMYLILLLQSDEAHDH